MTSDRSQPHGIPTVGDPKNPADPPHGTVLADKGMAYAPGFATAADQAALELDPELPEGSARRPYLQQVIYDALKPATAKFGMAWIAILAFFACFAPFIANSHPILLKTTDGQLSSPLLKHLTPVDVTLPVAFITAAVVIGMRRLSIGKGLALVAWTAALTLALSDWRSVPSHWEGLRGQREDLLSAPVAAAVLGVYGAVLVGTIVLLPLFVLPRQAAIIAGGILAPLLVALLVFPIRPPSNVVYEQYRELEKAGRARWVTRTLIPYSPSDRLRDHPDQEYLKQRARSWKDSTESRLQRPNGRHWGGTDNYGADLASRMIHACRIALAIGFIATGIAVVIGVVVGGLMGYFSGTVDLLGMRLIEILEAIPALVLLIAITAAFGRSLYLMMTVIGLLRWTGDARFIRAEFLKLRKLDFVQAAVATGLPTRSILFKHMLPNGVSPVLVSASFGVASAILLESTLSFLGLGLVDEPSWGEMLNQARAGGAGFNWWIATFPGMLIFLTVFSYNLVGEAIRDAMDPKLLKRD